MNIVHIHCVMHLILRIDTCGKNQEFFVNDSDWAYFILTQSIRMAEAPERHVENEIHPTKETSTINTEGEEIVFEYDFDEVVNQWCVC